jgi:4-amino-4-deoxy-L-arabinose transferase-like glycosyltransferase
MTTTTQQAPDPLTVELDPARPMAPARRRKIMARTLRGSQDDPPWARPTLLALLAGTALLYIWGLGASGYANDFYAAAVQAGTQSWKAMFFGSLDSANAITVDKPAFFLWPMEIASRIFGFSSWSMLVPQALEGVAAVGLLATTVRRTSGHAAGLLAGAALAVTPVAVLMFRFNNPDAMLVLLLTAAAYTLVRSLEAASTRWLALTGMLVGLGFITKMGQALIVVPALALTYLIAAPTSLRRRVTDLLVAGVAMVAGAGWYIAIVDLWPTSDRPYIGGSTNNSLLELALGYNGLGRLIGNAAGGAGRGNARGGNTGFGGATGITRMFSGDFATEVSWLLPTALIALVAGLWLTRRAPRTDLSRAALILFGGSLLVTGATFSFMQGTIHPYYSIALAPAIAALTAVTGRLLWQARTTWTGRICAALLVAVTAGWDAHLLALTPTFLPALRPLLIAAAALAAVAILAGPKLRKSAVIAVTVTVLVCLAGLGGSMAYAVDTASQAHSGSMPSSGPVAGQTGGGAGMRHDSRPGGTPPSDQTPGGTTTGQAPGGTTTTGQGSGGARGGQQANAAVTTLLEATSTRWAAATVGSQSAAPLELASGKAVIAIGGFGGRDGAPTLAQFQSYVAAGQIHYFIGGGSSRGAGGTSTTGTQISTWVAAHFTAKTVGGSTVYDLTVSSR